MTGILNGGVTMDLNDVLLDPSKYFKNPAEVIAADNLSIPQKLDVLRRWQRDAEQLQEAATEGMTGDEQSRLGEVKAAIEAVEAQAKQRRD